MSITITEVRNAHSLDSTNTRMYVEINHPSFGWIPYSIDHNDPDTTISNESLLSLIGSDFIAYVPKTSQEVLDEKVAGYRAERDSLLEVYVDPLVSNPLRWASLSEDKRSEWETYRSDLLNITDAVGFPDNFTWPQRPE
jgi:hypothetical protein